MIVLINRHCFGFEFIILRTWSNLVKHINKRRRHWFITFALESCEESRKNNVSDSEGKMRLGKKAPLLKALARSPPRIKFPAFQIFRPPPFPCLHEGANHGEKPTHNCPPQRRNHYLSSFTMRVWPTAFFGVQKSVHLAPRHFLRLTFFVVKIMGKGE